MRSYVISYFDQIGTAFGAGAGQRRSESVMPLETIDAQRRPAKRRLGAGFAVICLAGLVNSGPAFAAGGPYVVDDYELPAPGECQIESWASFGGGSDRIFVVAPSCTFAAAPWLEVGFAAERWRSNGDWTSAIGPTLKASVVPIDRFGVGIGFSATASYDWTARTMAGGAATVLFTVEPIERTRLNLNIGYERDQIDHRN